METERDGERGRVLVSTARVVALGDVKGGMTACGITEHHETGVLEHARLRDRQGLRSSLSRRFEVACLRACDPDGLFLQSPRREIRANEQCGCDAQRIPHVMTSP